MGSWTPILIVAAGRVACRRHGAGTGIEQDHSDETDPSVPTPLPADETSKRETEQCFESQATLSCLIKTNPSDKEKADTTASVVVESTKSKHLSSQDRPCLNRADPCISDQPQPKARLIPERRQEGERDRRASGNRSDSPCPSQDAPIAFGKAKLGQAIEQAFQDQAWTKWFASTYEGSQKIERVKFLRYVQLQVEESASNQSLPMTTQVKGSTYLRPSAPRTGSVKTAIIKNSRIFACLASSQH